MRTPEYKTLRQLVEGIREEAPEGEVQTYYMNSDGSRGARKETDKDIADNMRDYWKCMQSGAS